MRYPVRERLAHGSTFHEEGCIRRHLSVYHLYGLPLPRPASSSLRRSQARWSGWSDLYVRGREARTGPSGQDPGYVSLYYTRLRANPCLSGQSPEPRRRNEKTKASPLSGTWQTLPAASGLCRTRTPIRNRRPLSASVLSRSASGNTAPLRPSTGQRGV